MASKLKIDLKIPPALAAAMLELSRNLKKYKEFSERIMRQQQQTQAVMNVPSGKQPSFQNTISQIRNQFNRLNPVMNKFHDMLTRSNFKMIMRLGPRAQRFMRTFIMPPSIFSGMGNILRFVPSTAIVGMVPGIGWMFTVGYLAFRVVKWLYDKAVGLVDEVVKDIQAAIRFGTTIGGLRAFRIAFLTMPEDPRLLSSIQMARIDPTSAARGFIYGTLGVKRGADTLDDTISTFIAMQKFMKDHPGFEMFFATQYGAQALGISPETALALLKKSPEDLKKSIALYYKNKKRLELSPEQTAALQRLKMSGIVLYQALIARIPVIAVDTGLVSALTKLSNWMTKFVLWMASKFGDGKPNLPTSAVSPKGNSRSEIPQNNIKSSGIELSRTTSRLAGYSTRFKEQNSELSSRLAMIGPVLPGLLRRLIGSGAVGRGPGGLTFRPGVGPGRRGPSISGPTFRPGVGPGRRVTGPPPLKVPTSPGEAPESIKAATGGGFVRGGGSTNLKDDRARYAKELENNPALLERLLRVAANEQGTNPEGVQAVMESAMNRASVRGTSLAQQLRWHRSEGGYYDEGGMGRAEMADPKKKAILMDALKKVLAGSNVSNYATDNSSGPMADRQTADKSFIYRNKITGETFFAPGSDEKGLVPKWNEWYERMRTGGTQQVPDFTLQDIPGASQGDPASEPTVPGDYRPPGVTGGRFNVPRGSPLSGARETITLSNGVQMTVRKEAASQFQGFFNELIAAGAPVHNTVGYGERMNNASQHPAGLAVDWAQGWGRDGVWGGMTRVAPDVYRWITANKDRLKQIEDKWGISGGERWKGLDVGHFSIDTLYGKEHIDILRGSPQPQAKPQESSPPATSDSAPPPKGDDPPDPIKVQIPLDPKQIKKSEAEPSQKGDKLTHDGLKNVKVVNRSDAAAEIKWAGGGTYDPQTQAASPPPVNPNTYIGDTATVDPNQETDASTSELNKFGHEEVTAVDKFAERMKRHKFGPHEFLTTDSIEGNLTIKNMDLAEKIPIKAHPFSEVVHVDAMNEMLSWQYSRVNNFISTIGIHADMQKFEREARISTNVQDDRMLRYGRGIFAAQIRQAPPGAKFNPYTGQPINQ